MGVPAVEQEMTDELDRLLIEAYKKALSRTGRREARSVFPFSLMEKLVDKGLLALERAVRRLVTAIIR